MAAPGNQELDRIVFGTRPASDPANLDILLEQYKLFVETSERLVARRQVVNTFFLSANALALSALGLIAKEASGSPFTAVAMIAIAGASLVLCVAWKTLLRSYRQLNSGKFAVIDRLEERLPGALFRAEWAALGRGENPKTYKPFTATENVVSLIFIVVHALIALFALYWVIASFE